MLKDIKGIVVLKGTIELKTPMLIGSGENDTSDVDVLLDVEGKPFIPATSFIGVLKNHLRTIKDSIDENDWNIFWGYSEGDNSQQSCFSCSDLYSEQGSKVVIRDGVAINRETGMAKSGAKFDFEVVERATEFSLKLIAQYNGDNEIFIKKMFNTIQQELKNSNLRIGAKTQSGLGKVFLKDETFLKYDFSNQQDVIKYFEKKEGSSFDFTDKFDIKPKEFIIDAHFDTKTSMIVRSYSSNPSGSDAVHIQSKEDYILPGTSLKGAISSRAEKILRTKKRNGIADNIYNDLFGFVKKKEELKDANDKKAQRSRLTIEENILPKEKLVTELQTRIKIDRFTGGTISGALFDTMPLFRKDKTEKEKVVNIKMAIQDPKAYESGLLLLVLKDLWTGDLPIGGEKNIGRGVLEGVYAEISFENEESIKIADPNHLTENEKNKLQSYVDALNNYEVKNGTE